MARGIRYICRFICVLFVCYSYVMCVIRMLFVLFVCCYLYIICVLLVCYLLIKIRGYGFGLMFDEFLEFLLGHPLDSDFSVNEY